MSLTDQEKICLKKYGLTKLNTPKFTPDHKTKKAIVAIRDPKSKKIKIIRFGAQGMGHNYSFQARRNFKARHAKNIAKGITSAAYWADKFLWVGPKGHKKNPPKSQKQYFGHINRKKAA